MNSDIWHRAFCKWYDHHYGGHPRRAAAWGWIADRICRFNDAVGWREGTR